MKRRLGVVLVVFAVTMAAVWGYTNWQYVKDQYVAYRTPLEAESLTLLPKLDLTDKGRFLFKASRPEVLNAFRFNTACSSVTREQSIVLGCYTRQRFYVYNVTDERLAGVKEVTAAHELLHAVYERLSSKEKNALNQQLRTAAASIQDERFNATIEQYKRTEPGQVENELHSILGTEIAVLPEPLESHYRIYFNDRAKIVTYAKQYAETFQAVEQKIKAYDTQLQSLVTQKDQLELQLSEQQRSIEREKAKLDQLKSGNQVDEYNQTVPLYNQLVRNFNADVGTLKQIVEDYNEIVAKRNALAATQNELVKELDSTYQQIL